jgi:NAD(P)H-dependent flavin oxidoreductase YrpB (nitropropane dioxygenase family)
MCGAMTWVSVEKLIAAVGHAGGFGLVDKFVSIQNIIAELVDDYEQELQRLKAIVNR